MADSAIVEYLGENPNYLNFLDMENNKIHITPVKTGKIQEELVFDVDDKTMLIINESLFRKPRKFLFCSARDSDVPLNTSDTSKILRDPIKRIFNIDLEIRHLRAIHESYANRANIQTARKCDPIKPGMNLPEKWLIPRPQQKKLMSEKRVCQQ